jgi:hypothetical protein
MTDFDKSMALVLSALRQLAGGRFPLIAPKIAVSFDRPVHGGITDMDKRIIGEILIKAGARQGGLEKCLTNRCSQQPLPLEISVEI